MIYKTIITIIVIFVAVVVVVPLILSAVGIDIIPGAGRSGNSTGILLRSADAGATWKPVVFHHDRREPEPDYIYDVATHPMATTTLFAGTKGAGLWKSEDAGETWNEVRDSAGALDPQSDIYRVVVSRSRPEIMYVAAYQASRGRVFRSEDGGISFHQIYFVGQQKYGVFDIYTPPGSSDTVLVATGEGRLLVSNDGGTHWRFSKVFRDPIARLAMHPWYGSEGYVLTSRGQLFKTYDAARSWTDLGLPNRTLREQANRRVIEHPYTRISFTPSRSAASRQTLRDAVVLDPYHPGVIYRTQNGSILKSVNGGSAWQSLSTFIDGLNVAVGGIAVHPRDPNTLVVSAGQAVYTSTDLGINWSIVPFSTTLPLREIYIDPEVPRIMFVATGR